MGQLKGKKLPHTKYLFVTGGVISGLGKGISAASIGNLLRRYGYSVFVLKLDPYLNIDPGLISPYEHGEIFVTKDGGETDLDLGHYERFIDVELSKSSNFTSGKLLLELFEKERNGSYLGKTVQYIPHFINEIIEAILKTSKSADCDFMIVELGGTVGDIESNPFVYALSEFKIKFPQQFLLVHVTYVPFLNTSDDFKSKPTQNSVHLLGSFGLKPNLLLLRSEKAIDQEVIDKIATKSRLKAQRVINVPDLTNIYDAPYYFEERGVMQIINQHFNLAPSQGSWKEWQAFINLIKKPKRYRAKILMLGKYVEFLDAYKSIIEAFKIAAYYENIDLQFQWQSADQLNEKDLKKTLLAVDGIVILPGFGKRGFEMKVKTAWYSRDLKIPTFGICLGMQAMTVAQARRLGMKNATSKEFASDANELCVLDILKGRSKDKNMGGTLRLGNYPIKLKKGSLVYDIYQQETIIERHRHRYEVKKEFIDKLSDGDFQFSGLWQKENLPEVCESQNHPFYIGTQYHPEFTSRPLKPHPLYRRFLKATAQLKD